MRLPTELSLAESPGSITELEFACAHATDRPNGEAVAVAVDLSHVQRAYDLLFGTGIGVVSLLDANSSLSTQARLSMAAGAQEVAVSVDALAPGGINALQAVLGDTVPLTVDVTSPTGGLDLAEAERHLMLGADFVAYRPDPFETASLASTANLLALASELRLGGVKIGTDSVGDNRIPQVVRAHPWALADDNARLCLTLALPS